jgi:hypothetical protein
VYTSNSRIHRVLRNIAVCRPYSSADLPDLRISLSPRDAAADVMTASITGGQVKSEWTVDARQCLIGSGPIADHCEGAAPPGNGQQDGPVSLLFGQERTLSDPT